MSDSTNDKLAQRRSLGLPKLHQKMQQAKSQIDKNDPSTLPNRIALMLDCSGSMAGDKIQSLRDACTSYVQQCDFRDTALAIEAFPSGFSDWDEIDQRRANATTRIALTSVQPFLMTTVMSLNASGGTPLTEAMIYVLNTYSITRGIIVSDGDANNPYSAIESAKDYREAGIPVDCVHIGSSSQGEDTLQQIAELTGGKFIKFTDIASFGRSFKYLTPALYGSLTDGSASANLLGAKEIK